LNIASLQSGRLILEDSDHISPDDFVAWTRRVKPQADDLLFSYETRLGEAALMPPDVEACLGRRMALLRPNKAIVCPRYLLYLYLSPQFQTVVARETVQGATVNRIALSRMGSWPIRLHDRPTQLAIAEVLGALDDKIATNAAVSGQIERWTDLQYTRAISCGSSQFPLLDAIDIRFGEPFSGSSFTDPGIGRPLIRIRDLNTFTPQVWTTESRVREAVVERGDILVGMDAEFRPTPWLGQPGVMNQRVCRASSERLGSALVWQALKSPMRAIEGSKSATTVIHLNKSDLARSTVRLPTDTGIPEFRASCDGAYEYRLTMAVESRAIGGLRDTLLPELMAGRLRVRDAEKQVEAVV
jgi:type I restriction enzyme S subunit